MKETYPNIWSKGKKIYTKNLVKGEKAYTEKFVETDIGEMREWDPSKSKLGAAIAKQIPETGIKKDSKVLYLGAASGTTVSHVSDIVEKGVVFGVEYSNKVVNDLLRTSKNRDNLCPILGDARNPEEYSGIVDTVDLVFQDVAQPDQTKIFRKNCEVFLKDKGTGILAIKSRSISSSESKKKIFEEQEKKLSRNFDIVWKKDLEPFEKDHRIYLLKKK